MRTQRSKSGHMLRELTGDVIQLIGRRALQHSFHKCKIYVSYYCFTEHFRV